MPRSYAQIQIRTKNQVHGITFKHKRNIVSLNQVIERCVCASILQEEGFFSSI